MRRAMTNPPNRRKPPLHAYADGIQNHGLSGGNGILTCATAAATNSATTLATTAWAITRGAIAPASETLRTKTPLGR